MHAAVREKITVKIMAGAASVNAVNDNSNEGNSKYDPIELAHAKVLVNQ